MFFPLGISLNIKHNSNYQVLSSVLHTLCLEVITQRCFLKYVFIKARQNKHTE